MNDPPITAYWVVKANTNANVEELKQDRRDSAPVIYRLMGKNSNSHIYGSASSHEWSMIVRNDSRDEGNEVLVYSRDKRVLTIL